VTVQSKNRPGYKQTEIGEIPKDWSILSLDEITDPTRPIGYGIVQTGPQVWGGVRCLRVVDIVDGRIDESELITTSEEISQAYKRTILRPDDLVIALRGKLGAIAKIGVNLAGANLTRGVALLSSSDRYHPEYLRFYLSSTIGQNLIEKNLNGSALQEIPIASLRRLPVATPPLAEQIAIAEALKGAEARIAALEALITKKRDLKQAAMQQLLTGKTRLPGFSSEWETVKLGELAEMSSGGTPTSSVSAYYGGHIPWVSISDMTGQGKFISSTERKLTDLGLKNCSAKLFPTGTLLYAMYASLGECSIAEAPLCSSQAILGIQPHANTSAQFLYYYLSSIRPTVKLMGQHGTQSNLNKAMIQNFQLRLPPYKEQLAITEILSDMDEEIAALEAEAEKAHAIKQGMMQTLLTGKVRLV